MALPASSSLLALALSGSKSSRRNLAAVTSSSASLFLRCALARRCARAPKGRIWRTHTGREAAPHSFADRGLKAGSWLCVLCSLSCSLFGVFFSNLLNALGCGLHTFSEAMDTFSEADTHFFRGCAHLSRGCGYFSGGSQEVSDAHFFRGCAHPKSAWQCALLPLAKRFAHGQRIDTPTHLAARSADAGRTPARRGVRHDEALYVAPK